jgi:hypothetical protein
MGNFKHQSLRTSDRDRDKDIDKDRERDMREKEGQERLRNVGFCYNTIFQINNTFQLSDKYDRDRLTLPGSMNALRNKQRDTASHLATGTSRPSPRNHIDNGISRQVDAKDSGKKKAGENSEDWRKGWFFHSFSSVIQIFQMQGYYALTVTIVCSIHGHHVIRHPFSDVNLSRAGKP